MKSKLLNVIYNLKLFCSIDGPAFFYDNHELRTDVLNKILSLITDEYYCNKEESEIVEIWSGLFANVTDDYIHYLKYLEFCGIIHRSNTFVSPELAKHKGIQPKMKGIYFMDQFKKDIEITKIQGTWKIYKFRINPPLNIISKKLADKMYNDYDSLQVNPDYIVPKDDGKYIDFKNYLHNSIYLSEIYNGRKTFKWRNDGILQDGRLYSTFTFLSSNTRKNGILLNGERIVEFDIKNSFPLFLGIWMLKNGLTVNEIETKEWLTSLRNSNFYMMLFHNYNKNDVKKTFLSWLNGGSHPKLDNVLKLKYNEVWVFLNNIKNNQQQEWLYFQIAQIESRFIFNILCQTLYDEIPLVKIITCHDAIYVPESFKIPVSIIWNEEIEKLKQRIPLFSECNENFVEDEYKDDDITELLEMV